MTAGLLAGLMVAAVIAGACLIYALGAGIPLLGCLTVALVSAGGALNELADARYYDRRGEDESRWQARETPFRG